MASYNDAKLIIKHYHLRKDVAPGPFAIFTSQNIVLCLSEDNSAAANAAAAAYMLTRWVWARDGIFVHINFAPDAPLSRAYSVSDGLGSKPIYPELLNTTPPFLQEGPLQDAAAHAAFIAAARFLPLKQIIILQNINETLFPWLEDICCFPTFI